jgi:hypothetical protein
MTGLDVAEIQMWARMSGAIARYYFNHTQVWNKTDSSLVTQADGIRSMVSWGKSRAAIIPSANLCG